MDVFFEQEIDNQGVNQQWNKAPYPEKRNDKQDDKIDDDQFGNHFLGVCADIEADKLLIEPVPGIHNPAPVADYQAVLAKLLFAAQAACCNRAEKKGDEKAKEKNNRQKQIQRPGQMQRRKNMLCQVRKELSLLNAADQMSQEIGSLKKQTEKHCCYLDRKLADGKAADTVTSFFKQENHKTTEQECCSKKTDQHVGNPGGTIALILEAIVIGIAHEQIPGRKNLLILLLGDGINDPHIRRTGKRNTVTVSLARV